MSQLFSGYNNHTKYYVQYVHNVYTLSLLFLEAFCNAKKWKNPQKYKAKK